MERVVDDQNPLESVHPQQLLGILDTGPLLDRDQALARSHDRPDRLVEVGFEAQIAVGDDADHLPRPVDHGQTGNAVLGGDLENIANRHQR